MGITQQSAAARLIQPGVCTSSTRPASPFEGQAIFETDTDRMLIWNGTAWVIPNAPAQNPTGLELITTQTVTSQTEMTFYSSLSSTYTNYLLIGNFTASGTTEIRLQMASGTSLNQTTNYRFFQNEMTASTVSTTYTDNTTFWYVSNSANVVANGASFKVDLFSPQATGRTLFRSSTVFEWVSDVTYYREVSGRFNGTNQFDGFRLFTNSANMTGTATLYGYRK